MVSSLPHEDRGETFQDQWGFCFFIWTMRDSFIWEESQLGISLGGLQYQFLAQLANAGPKSVKVNLTNYHREFCKSNFIKLSLLMSLHLCDNLIKCYFNNLEHVFTHWVHYWSFKGSQMFSEMLNPHQYNDFIDLV